MLAEVFTACPVVDRVCVHALGQAIEDMWEGFRREFLGLWSAAVKRGSAGDLAPAQLFGAAAAGGSEALQVGARFFACMIMI